MAPFRIGFYESDDFDAIKHTIAPFLCKIEAVESGRWSLDDCLEGIQNGSLIPLVVWENETVIAVATVRICEARIKYLVIEDVAGDRLDEWITQAFNEVEKLAVILKCKQITVGGRAGWEKYFKRYGFTKSRVEGFKNIED